MDTCTRSERHGDSLASRGVLMLGLVGVASLMAPAAHAQLSCNFPFPPFNTPPLPPVQANFSNQTFGNAPPLTPFAVTSTGLVGCNGAAGAPPG